MSLPARVVYSCLFFVLTVALIIVARPAALFGADGRPLPLGSGPGRTMFPLGVVIAVVAILTLYLFAMIDVVYR
jgi:hypothetical protein